MYHYSSFSSKKQKRVLHLSGAGGTNRRGEEGEGGYEPSPVVVPGPPIPSFPFARPCNCMEVRFLERSEVIGREDCWREISIHYTPLYSKGKAKVRSCAFFSVFQLKKGALEATQLLRERGKGVKHLST